MNVRVILSSGMAVALAACTAASAQAPIEAPSGDGLGRPQAAAPFYRNPEPVPDMPLGRNQIAVYADGAVLAGWRREARAVDGRPGSFSTHWTGRAAMEACARHAIAQNAGSYAITGRCIEGQPIGYGYQSPAESLPPGRYFTCGQMRLRARAPAEASARYLPFWVCNFV